MTMAEATPSIQQKPYFEEGTEAMIALEGYGRSRRLAQCRVALAQICWAKAEHVETNWQDQLARDWNANAAMLDSFAAKLFNEQTRVELFARETVPGWSVYGFEAGVALAAE